MKYKVIAFTLFFFLIYTVFNFGLRKFVIWFDQWIDNGNKKPERKYKRRKSNNKKNTREANDRPAIMTERYLLGSTQRFLIILTICLVIIIYAIVKLP